MKIFSRSNLPKKLVLLAAFAIIALILLVLIEHETGFVTHFDEVSPQADISLFIVILVIMAAVFLIAFFHEHRHEEEMMGMRKYSEATK